MSKKVKIVLNRDGVREMMQSAEMQSLLSETASAIVSRCGPGYSSDIYVGRNRANAMVKTETFEARRDNRKNNTILKAVQ